MTKKKRHVIWRILFSLKSFKKGSFQRPPPPRGNQGGKDCEEMQGVSVGHSFKVFEVTSKGRAEACKKVEFKEMRTVALFYCLF